jgi:hypothetical protein
MMRSSIIVVIACGVLAAGCGGGGAPSSSSSSKAAVVRTSTTSSAAVTTPSATTTTTTTPARRVRHHRHHHSRRPPSGASGARGPTGPTAFLALPSSGTPTPSPPSRALQIAACRQMVASDTALVLTLAEARGLDRLCGLYGSKNPAKVAAAKLQICLLVVKDSGLPSAAARAERESCHLDQQG